MNKILISLLILSTIVMVPVTSMSKTSEQTITLTSDNLLVLNSQVDGDSVGAIILKAKELDQKLSGMKEKVTGKKPIYLFINSPGGSIQSGLELIEMLKGLGRPVHTITSFGASMAWQIAQNLNTRFILKSGKFMSHHAAGQFQGQFGGTFPSQLDNRLRLWTQIVKELDETTVKRTNGKQTLKSYQEAYNSELWLTGPESVEQGYSDAVVSIKCGESLTGTTKHTQQFMGVNVSFDTDNCPINTSPLNAKVEAVPGVSAEFLNHIKEQFLSSREMKMKTPLPLVF